MLFFPSLERETQVADLRAPLDRAILQNLLLDGTDVDPAAYTVAKAIRSKKTVSPLPQIYLIHGT